MTRHVVVACAGPPGYLDVLCNDCDGRIKVHALTIKEAVVAAEALGWRSGTDGSINCNHPTGRIAVGHREASRTLLEYLQRQWEWSLRTFGPGKRTGGILEHITKELKEIEAQPDDLVEWCDVMILAMDGFWRHGGKPEDLLPMLEAKQQRNFARRWPAPGPEDKASEHVR